MKFSLSRRAALALAAILCLSSAAAVVATPAAATEPAALSVTIKDHRFEPAELRAPANTPIELAVKNLDPTPEEFESDPLRVEKIVPGNGSITVKIRPMKPGRYKFEGEYHEDTAQGVLIVE
jgi:hypothetical protein